MANELTQLTSDQVRRIFRDHLKGVPHEKILKKNDISEDTLSQIIGLYGKKKHPNDVGNAEDILGPLDLLVTPLDTGSQASEHPVIARNPKDMRVVTERPMQEYDWNGPEEEARKRGGELTDIITKRTDETRKAEAEQAKEALDSNKEATDAALEELARESASQKEALASQAVETAEATEAVEEILERARTESEQQVIAENKAETARAEEVRKYAEDNAERDKKLIEEGKKQNEQAAQASKEASLAEAADRGTISEEELRRAQQEHAGREGKTGVRPSK